MGLFSASDLDVTSASAEFGHALIAGETILAAFRTIRDSVLLTDQRLIYINVQGLTGSKVEFQSVPWRSVVRFALETAGTFDLDADMKIWVSGAAEPLQVKVSRKSDPRVIQRIMAEQTLLKR
ncbi:MULTISPECIES: PH domain-containing protein [unclassified Sphingopyxis]|jgi:hypothetical protein|uniref:PH domain-containing protein n=1 Tax=unclassified Sphingopyxis TaxID=2614943 RepID=UPI0025E651EA|nr:MULTISPECIES: PH domain-containing protein [unclassified Sphingopyxis]MBA4308521.1 PH domain-containing protein [Sphingopyxis sp.]HEV7341837.1 PH domain-containing protein [Sphingopyxis sp.]